MAVLLSAGGAQAVFNGIPPASSVPPDSVSSVTIQLPGAPPQQAVDRKTCEQTKTADETCPEGFDWFVKADKPFQPGAVISATFLASNGQTVADGQFAVNRFGRFGDWLTLNVAPDYASLPGASAGQGFSLDTYLDQVEDAFRQSGFPRVPFISVETVWRPDAAPNGTSTGSGTAINMPAPIVDGTMVSTRVPVNTTIDDALRDAGIRPTTGYSIPADDGGGYVIGGYKDWGEGIKYNFRGDNLVQIDEPPGTPTPRTSTPGTGPGTATGPGDTGALPPGDLFGPDTQWTEHIYCREELQNGSGAPKVNVRPKGPDVKDFAEGKSGPEWDPAKDGKEPSVADPKDADAVRKAVEQEIADGAKAIELEFANGNCVRTLAEINDRSDASEGIAPITGSTVAAKGPPPCPYPTGKISAHFVDEEVYNPIFYGTTETFTDLADIVAKLQRKVAPHYDPTARCGRCIEQVDVWGHGDTGGGYISFGPNDAQVGNVAMGANFDQNLATLGGLMCVGGKVVINQCKAGSGAQGTKALQALADKIGVPVSGPTEKIKGCRIFGGLISNYKEQKPSATATTPSSRQPADVTPPPETKKP
ncbi:MAG: hypothetical protein GC201_12535 [Alphaproteobacteria bacterium]|nr:hypothetical protein [Alphaproteobacteria bacterium]